MLARFRAQFPEFADTSDAAIEAWIENASEITSVSDTAKLYCAAHLLALSQETHGGADEGAGEVRMERIGPKWVEYKAQALFGWEVFFTRSRYGRMLLLLERRAPSIGMSVRVYGK